MAGGEPKDLEVAYVQTNPYDWNHAAMPAMTLGRQGFDL